MLPVISAEGQLVPRDTYRNLCMLPAVFVVISERGLCHIDIQQNLPWILVNSGGFLGGQRQELTWEHIRVGLCSFHSLTKK